MLGWSMTVMVNVLQVLKSPSLPKNALEEAWFLLYASISRARPSLWPGSFSFVPSRLVDRVILMPAYRELKPHFIDKSRMMENNNALNLFQFCVTQGYVEQGAIAKKSSLISQRETPAQLSNKTRRSWCCVLENKMICCIWHAELGLTHLLIGQDIIFKQFSSQLTISQLLLIRKSNLWCVVNLETFMRC